MGTDSWQAWLPESALDFATVERLLAGTVEEWSGKWFARRPLRIHGGLARCGLDGSGGDAGWHRLEEGVALAVPTPARSAIAGALLGAVVDDKSLSVVDRELVDRLAAGCLDDLRARLAQLIGLPRDAVWRGEAPDREFLAVAWSCAVGAGAAEGAIRIVLGAERVVGLIKRSVRSAPAPVALRPVTDGLARQPLGLFAFVGGCELPLAEVAALGEGDVVVLDRDVDQPLELAPDGARRSGRCRLEIDDERIQLKIEQPFFE